MKKKPHQKKGTKELVTLRNFNPESLIDFIKYLVSSEQARNIKQTYISLVFHRYLQKQTPLNFQKFKINFKDTLYRVSTHKYSPISITGSLIHGGRYNIGGSQLHKLINIQPFSALYFSTDLQCAIDEYTHGTPLCHNDIKYALKPSRKFELWDINKITQSSHFLHLNDLIYQGPIFSLWTYCKVPMHSQILGTWLKKIGGDGIMFRSTKNPKSSCIALFVDNDLEAESLFSEIKTL